MKKLISVIIKALYRLNSTVIAFIGGGIISVSINLLTGISSYLGSMKWIVLAASLVLLVDSIFLLIWQNIASSIQENYKPWLESVKKYNAKFNKEKPTDLSAFIIECDEHYKNKNKQDTESSDDSLKTKFPKYSITHIVAFPILSICLFMLGIGLMIWSFI